MMNKRQLAMVMTSTSALVVIHAQWPARPNGLIGRDYMYWNNVETMPGKGYPKDWQKSGGGFKETVLQENGRTLLPEDYGLAWEYNLAESLFEENKTHVKPHYNGKPIDPKWGANWDEDMGSGEFPNSHFLYLPRICNHCTRPPAGRHARAMQYTSGKRTALSS